MDDIENNGIAAIPWVMYSFNNTDTYLDIQEYQYITIGNGDMLYELTVSEEPLWNLIKLNNNWLDVDAASYFWATDLENGNPDAEEKHKLPKLPDGFKWQVRSGLTLNVGPTTQQILYKRKKTVEDNSNGSSGVPDTITKTDGLTITGIGEGGQYYTKTIESGAVEEDDSFAIKLNYLLQTTIDTLNTSKDLLGQDLNTVLMSFNYEPATIESIGDNTGGQYLLNWHNFNSK